MRSYSFTDPMAFAQFRKSHEYLQLILIHLNPHSALSLNTHQSIPKSTTLNTNFPNIFLHTKGEDACVPSREPREVFLKHFQGGWKSQPVLSPLKCKAGWNRCIQRTPLKTTRADWTPNRPIGWRERVKNSLKGLKKKMLIFQPLQDVCAMLCEMCVRFVSKIQFRLGRILVDK